METELLDERSKEREIGSVTYKVRPIAFGAGLKALNRLIKVLAPIVGAALREGRPVDRAAAVIELLPEHLTDDDLDYFRRTFGAGAWYRDGDDGEEKWIALVKTKDHDAQEMHFAGRYLEFLEWLIFCVEVNYSGFFNGAIAEAKAGVDASQPKAGGIFATLAAILKGKATAPTISTPTRGSGLNTES